MFHFIYRLFKDNILNLNSPHKTRKIYEPTISSIRKAKVVTNPNDSSLSSRSMSKDKSPTISRKLKPAGKYITKGNSTTDDYKTPYNRILSSKKSLPGLKKVTQSSSQRSLKSNDSSQNTNQTVVIPAT